MEMEGVLVVSVVFHEEEVPEVEAHRAVLGLEDGKESRPERGTNPLVHKGCVLGGEVGGSELKVARRGPRAPRRRSRADSREELVALSSRQDFRDGVGPAQVGPDA